MSLFTPSLLNKCLTHFLSFFLYFVFCHTASITEDRESSDGSSLITDESSQLLIYESKQNSIALAQQSLRITQLEEDVMKLLHENTQLRAEVGSLKQENENLLKDLEILENVGL